MALVVKKFGGTSLGDLERIRRVAGRIKDAVDGGDQVAVVVSAMSGTTDQLIELATDATALQDAREYDVVVSSGEQVTCGLLAMILQQMGVAARSWMGWQIPIGTDGAHGSARVTKIDSETLHKCLAEGETPVVAGFQGLSPDNRVTTMGRGGSDITAVALAAALKADRCDIYTDVDGVYTADPSVVAKARKLDKITYEEMLELASLGAKVLQTRSVELAMSHNVRLQVRSSFNDTLGTLVVNEDEIVEQEIVSGITCSSDEAKITLVRVADRPNVAASIFGPLTAASINVDMIVQNVSADGSATDLTFTVPRSELDKAIAAIESASGEIGYQDLVPDPDVVKVSVVGLGMRSHAGVAQRMFETLGEKGINIQVISTSEIKISVLISADYTELALRALHTAYGLDGE